MHWPDDPFLRPIRTFQRPEATELRYGHASRGLHRFRVTQTYLRDHAVPMIRARRHRALLLDLALRGMSRSIGPTLGKRDPQTWAGVTIDRASQPELHALIHGPTSTPEDAQREWVRGQIGYLERRGLAERITHKRRGAHTIRVLRDDGSRRLHTDPAGTRADAYVTINGTLFASGAIVDWSGAEVAFYLAAMIGEAMSRRPPDMTHRGDGEWYRSYDWFADTDGSRRPAHHVRVPFTKQTLINGQRRLSAKGFVKTGTISRDPRTGKAFANGGSRNAYLNRFETRSLQLLHANGVTHPFESWL